MHQCTVVPPAFVGSQAWMEIAHLAWNLRAWIAQLVLPEETSRWEWKRFRQAFVFLAAQVFYHARQVWIRFASFRSTLADERPPTTGASLDCASFRASVRPVGDTIKETSTLTCALALAAALLASCGQTTQVLDGAAGQPGDCDSLELSGPIVAIVGDAGWRQRQPALTISSDDRSRVILAFEQAAEGTPGAPPSELRYASLLPWEDDWPLDAAIASAEITQAGRGASFAVAPSGGDRVAIAFTSPEPSGAVLFSPDLVPGAGLGAPPATVYPSAAGVLFAAQGPTRYLIGYVGHPETRELRLALEGLPDTETLISACATADVRADAVPFAGGWLVAYSSGVSSPWDCWDAALMGPPDRIQINWLADDIPRSNFNDHFSVGRPVAQLDLAARPGGAWIVWTELGGDVARLMLAEVGATGELGGLPVRTDLAASPPSSFAVADLGDSLALAWVNDPTGGLDVAVTGAHQGLYAGYALSTEGPVQGRPALLGSPDGRRLLVAWSEARAGTGGDRVRVARLECTSSR